MTETRRIVFVASSGQVSGAEKVMADLVVEAQRTGYDVVVACPDGPLTGVLPADATHLAIPSLGLAGESGLARVAAMARLVARWVAAGRRLAPLVRDPATATVVNSLFALPALRVAHPPNGVSWLVHDTVVSAKQRAVVRLSAPAVRLAVAVSEATAAPLRAAGLTVEVAHNGVRWPVPDLFTDLHRPPVVGMLALLTPWKGHRVLLDAAGRLPGIEVELAGGSFPGDVDYVSELEERASRPDLAGRVRFLGHTDPQAALRRWDIVVSASTSPEAGPLSVLEAMSHGLPVIGTDHGGTSEFLCDGAGVLVAPSDPRALASAIENLVDDDGLRRSVARTGRQRVADRHDLAATLPAMLTTLLS
ncbi:glycosyltransferase family 4 protein [Williamsia maris]|uniref:Glycosyltransferase involved in cell wall bisynthesis n=1 Tax=Williamsia maris TaxID=72806 RepID=A0ABT1HI24_9NOCA|nr:glycosyltransferase family 4 protein [Williamsia maris]MCP2177588.1 Glycosyltransferase involved in cell wall bisynthesis [Williamsia maris]